MLGGLAALFAATAYPGAIYSWMGYEGVQCIQPKTLGHGYNRTLEECKYSTANPFVHFINWDGNFDGTGVGTCTAYSQCDNPVCGTANNTYHALKRDPWVMGCAKPKTTPPTPPPPPSPTPAEKEVLPCFDPSCRHWNDTDGNRIEAHAAGMLQAPDGRWYWYGESKKTANLHDHGVNCYSAETIAGPWKNEGTVLYQQNITGVSDPGPYIVERPKVLYNEETKTYVMWFHLDNSSYRFKNAGVATSKTPNGPFTFLKGFQPDGKPSYDMSLWKDPVDHQAYFVRSVNNAYTAISRLTPDYLSSTGMISNHSVFEGMALFRHPNGTYYIVGSHLTGWSPNPLMLFRAAGKTLDDPQWVAYGNPTGDPTSYNTQPTYVVEYTPLKGDPYFVYMGDNWIRASQNPSDNKGLIDAAYVWLPFWINDEGIQLHRQTSWNLDAPYPSCPQEGTRLFLSQCGRDGQNFALKNGTGKQKLQLTGNGPCVTFGPSGEAMLGDCGSAPEFEWVNGQLTVAGECLDIGMCYKDTVNSKLPNETNTVTEICPGRYLWKTQCDANHHGNQELSLSSKGELLSTMWASDIPICVTACL